MPNGTIDALLIAVANYIAGLATQITNWLAGRLDQALTILLNVGNAILAAVGDVFNTVGNFLQAIFSRFEVAFNAILLRIENAFTAVWNQIVQLSVGALNAIAAFVEGLWGQVASAIGAIIDRVRGFVESAVSVIRDLAENVINAIVTLLSDVGRKIGDILRTIFAATDQAIAAVVTNLGAAIDRVLGGAESLISTIGERLVSLREAFADAAQVVADKVGELAAEQLEPLRDLIKSFVDALIADAPPAERQDLALTLDRFVKGPLTPDLIRDFFGEGWIKMIPEGGFASRLFFALFTILGVVPFIASAASIQANKAIEGIAVEFPWQRIPPADAAQAWRRGALDRDSAREAVQRKGFSAEDASAMIDNTAQLPSDRDLIASWLREELSEKGLDDAFFQRGYSPGHAGNLKRLAQVIPPVGDLITMAVREVFTPAIAERFGQFQDFPEAFKVWAERQGLSEFWARNYWAAHWSLPSAFQGFEMLHRRVISESDLDLLLKSLDVMPFWREGLKKIAFNPFTRVDIRRMHQLGILDENAVFEAHLDIGYDETKARQLTDFVLRLNKKTPAEDDVELGKLSRSSVLGFFADGIIDRQRALDLLVGMGHTPDAALLYIQSEELDKQRKERKGEADHIVDLAAAGSISFAQAQDRLNALGLSRLEVERALTQLIRAQERLTKLPTRTEGERMFRERLINEPDFRDLLSRQGYAPKWINAFVAIAKGKSDGGSIPG